MDDHATIIGVRLTRRDRVRFVHAPGLTLPPGAVVVVVLEDQEALGTVVVGTGQLLSGSVGASVQGHVRRVATETDLRELGRRSAAARGVPGATRQAMTERGASAQLTDAYFSPDRSRLFLELDRLPAQPDWLARELTNTLQVPVELVQRSAPDAVTQPLTGVHAAGVAADWTDWLVEVGAEAAALGVVDDAQLVPWISEVMQRMFPSSERGTDSSPADGDRPVTTPE